MRILPSSCLNFIPRSFRKVADAPLVLFSEQIEDFDGLYYRPGPYILGDDEDFDMGWVGRNGVIVLFSTAPNVIAHEYRHHIQARTNKFCSETEMFDFKTTEGYVNYYSYNINEFDALSFEIKLGLADDELLWWYSYMKEQKRGYFREL